MSDSGILFPFNADITDCLLTTLLDFQSLQAFISSSQFVYSVFRCRQNSILGSVAICQFGTVLPLAMRLVRCIEGVHFAGLTHEAHLDMGTQSFVITPAQARLLREHAAVIQALEDIYSWREKEPRSRTSHLSAAESLRFQQSMYKFWFLVAAYGPGALASERFEYSIGEHLQLKDSIVTKQTGYLLSLGSSELIGVHEVHEFLLTLAKGAILLSKLPAPRTRTYLGTRAITDAYLVWRGPAVTLDAHKGKLPSFDFAEAQRCDIWRAMTSAFSTTQIASITSGRDTRQGFLLDDYFLKNTECRHCRTPSFAFGVASSRLWSIHNWEYMILDIPPMRLWGSLSLEEERRLELLLSFQGATDSIPYSQFIEEIFDVRSAQYSEWKKDDWLCTGCMNQMLSDNICAWFYKTKCNH